LVVTPVWEPLLILDNVLAALSFNNTLIYCRYDADTDVYPTASCEDWITTTSYDCWWEHGLYFCNMCSV